MTPRRGLVWPLLLIAIGVVFLLANFGYIAPLSALALLSLWPLLLIVVGVDIAIGRQWPLAALGINVLIIGLGIAIAVAQPALPGPWVSFGSDPTGDATVTVPRGSESSLSLRVSGGAARFDLAGGGTDLVRVDSDREDLRLRESERRGDRMEVRIDQGANGTGWRFGPARGAEVTVRISPDVPTSLRLDAGAGEFTLDLRSVKLADADINVGAASFRLVAPTPTGDVPISIDAGASSIVVEVPDGVEARVTASGGLLSTRTENARFVGSETGGYASAKDRVTIKISAGASSVVIR